MLKIFEQLHNSKVKGVFPIQQFLSGINLKLQKLGARTLRISMLMRMDTLYIFKKLLG